MAKATDIPALVRKIVNERDGEKCRVCGRGGQAIEHHHIVYRSQDRNNHSPENLISCCGACHRMAHTHPEVMRPALQHVVDKLWLTAFAHLRHQGIDTSKLRRGTL